MSYLTLDKVNKTYETESGRRVQALVDIDLTVAEGGFVSLVGPSGCGKTTLLEIVAGLRPASSGRVLLAGAPLDRGKTSLGVVFQEDSVFPWRNVLQNVAFGLEVKGVPAAARLARSRDMIQLVGLGGFETSLPAELSGGMRQRVAIARALALDPALLLMDEPFGALDEQTRFLLGLELQRIWQQTRKTVLFVTHSISEAVLLSDRVIVLSARPGRIAEDIPIDLPRPRNADTLGAPAFGALMARIWNLLTGGAAADARTAHAAP